MAILLNLVKSMYGVGTHTFCLVQCTVLGRTRFVLFNVRCWDAHVLSCSMYGVGTHTFCLVQCTVLGRTRFACQNLGVTRHHQILVSTDEFVIFSYFIQCYLYSKAKLAPALYIYIYIYIYI